MGPLTPLPHNWYVFDVAHFPYPKVQLCEDDPDDDGWDDGDPVVVDVDDEVDDDDDDDVDVDPECPFLCPVVEVEVDVVVVVVEPIRPVVDDDVDVIDTLDDVDVDLDDVDVVVVVVVETTGGGASTMVPVAWLCTKLPIEPPKLLFKSELEASHSMTPPYCFGKATFIASEMSWSCESDTYPLPAPFELAGAPMNNFTLGLSEVEDAQLAQVLKLNLDG